MFQIQVFFLKMWISIKIHICFPVSLQIPSSFVFSVCCFQNTFHSVSDCKLTPNTSCLQLELEQNTTGLCPKLRLLTQCAFCRQRLTSPVRLALTVCGWWLPLHSARLSANPCSVFFLLRNQHTQHRTALHPHCPRDRISPPHTTSRPDLG